MGPMGKHTKTLNPKPLNPKPLNPKPHENKVPGSAALAAQARSHLGTLSGCLLQSLGLGFAGSTGFRA